MYRMTLAFIFVRYQLFWSFPPSFLYSLTKYLNIFTRTRHLIAYTRIYMMERKNYAERGGEGKSFQADFQNKTTELEM